MICENCGAKIGDDEDYCPNCGMELFIPKSKRKPVSKKPLKERYLDGEYQDQEDYEDIYESYGGYDEPETPRRRDHPKKPQKQDYESYYEYDDYEPAPSKRSNGMGATLIILIAALIIGFMIGIMVFSGTSQVVPSLKIG
jgi:ribosomal protein L40E